MLSSIDVSDFGSTRVIPSVCASPNEQNRMISVSGVLRTTLTYAVPSQLSIGTGASRIAASAVPRISAPIAENTVSWIVVQNASKIWPRYSLKTSTSVRTQQAAGAGGAGVAMPAGPRFLSNAAFQAPSASIFFSASVILVHNSVSPFFSPMP